MVNLLFLASRTKDKALDQPGDVRCAGPERHGNCQQVDKERSCDYWARFQDLQDGLATLGSSDGRIDFE